MKSDIKSFAKAVLLSAVLPLFIACSPSNDGERTFRHKGMDRTYYLYVPENPLPQRPLVFMLHGYTGQAKTLCPEMVKASLDAGFAICVPQGAPDGRGNSCWNVGYPFQEGLETDDVDFICSLSKHLQKRYHFGKSFMTGMSNGGEMCYLLSYLRPEQFGAFAPIAGLTMKWMADSLSAKAPVNIMEVHGTEDRVSEWTGDPQNAGGWGAYLAVPDAIAFWAEEAGCSSEKIERFNDTVVLHRYCGGTRKVLLYEVVGGDHSWSLKSMDTPACILNFFKSVL